jgi:peptidoglycan hydrolase CwlO-like protein
MPDATYKPQHPLDVVVSETNPLVRVYNKTNRAFHYAPFVLGANTFSQVTQPVADFFINTRPNEVVSASTAAKELGGAQARASALQAELDEAKKQIQVLQSIPKVDRASAMLATAQGRIKELEAQVIDLTDQLDKATAPKVGADAV